VPQFIDPDFPVLELRGGRRLPGWAYATWRQPKSSSGGRSTRPLRSNRAPAHRCRYRGTRSATCRQRRARRLSTTDAVIDRTSILISWWCGLNTTALQPCSSQCFADPPGRVAAGTVAAPNDSADRPWL
jgi:hypothetical protein